MTRTLKQNNIEDTPQDIGGAGRRLQQAVVPSVLLHTIVTTQTRSKLQHAQTPQSQEVLPWTGLEKQTCNTLVEEVFTETCLLLIC